jgi:hypothetical protein
MTKRFEIPDSAVEAALEAILKETGAQYNTSLAMRAALEAALPIILGEPVAWLVPHIITFKGVTRTSCPEHLQPEIEGTVAWGAELYSDGDGVTDKHGVRHVAKPLYDLTASKEKGDV